MRIPFRISSTFGFNPVQYIETSHEYRYNCPECLARKGKVDTKGHLYVNELSFKFHCFRCGYSGKIGYIDKDTAVIYEDDKETDSSVLLKQLTDIVNPELTESLKIPIDKVTTNKSATEYLLNRGFTYEQMEYYDMKVGNLHQEFGRLIIPNKVEKLVYTDMYSARTFIDQTPKYHNPSGKKKSELVFNLHRIKEDDAIILVEGALTAIASGYHAVASLGKTLSKSQASQIAQKHPHTIFVNYDYGAEKELIDASRLLHKMIPSAKIKMVFMKDERDSADLSHEEYASCLANAVDYNEMMDNFGEYNNG